MSSPGIQELILLGHTLRGQRKPSNRYGIAYPTHSQHGHPNAPQELIKPTFTIERSNNCDFNLNTAECSNQYCTVRQLGGDGGIAMVGDHSSNGTLVNGREMPAKDSHVVEHKDQIEIRRVGLSLLRVVPHRFYTLSFEIRSMILRLRIASTTAPSSTA